MRKGKNFRQLGRDPEHRWAMLRNMVTSLVKHERIITTTARAKELRRVADRVVGYAKKGDLHNRRLALRILRETPMATKLFEILGPRYQDRQGGYTRILKLGRPRRGDSADMAVIEFVDREGELRKAKPPSGGYFMAAVKATPLPTEEQTEAREKKPEKPRPTFEDHKGNKPLHYFKKAAVEKFYARKAAKSKTAADETEQKQQ